MHLTNRGTRTQNDNALTFASNVYLNVRVNLDAQVRARVLTLTDTATRNANTERYPELRVRFTLVDVTCYSHIEHAGESLNEQQQTNKEATTIVC